MNIFYHDGAGLIHFLSSLCAMFFGIAVLLTKKGTRKHIRLGYLYFTSMVMLLATSFLIQRLFTGFGLFHWAALASILILIIGLFPVWFKKPRKNWKELHFSFMYWSVVALYEAFMSEVLTRIPKTSFMLMVAIGTGSAFIVGLFIFIKKKKQWSEEINLNNTSSNH